MRWPPHLLLCLCACLGAAERAAAPAVSGDDLAELEQLKQKMRADSAEPVAPKPTAVKGAMSPEDQAELDALRSQIKARQPEAPTAPAVLVQLIRTEIDGLELVLVLEATIPTPVVIQGRGHTLGQKFTVQGTYSGAAKFEGAYYPLLKSAEPVVNVHAEKTDENAASATRPVLGAGAAESDEGFGGFQLSNILFAGFAAISLAIVGLKAKAKFDAMKGRKRRR
jgi:hypothetical protein